MKKQYKIGVLFCGGCNCYFDREEFYDRIRKNLSSKCSFFYYSTESTEDFDLIVLINGCQSECLMGDSYSAPLLVINNKNCDVAEELIEKLLTNE